MTPGRSRQRRRLRRSSRLVLLRDFGLAPGRAAWALRAALHGVDAARIQYRTGPPLSVCPWDDSRRSERNRAGPGLDPNLLRTASPGSRRLVGPVAVVDADADADARVCIAIGHYTRRSRRGNGMAFLFGFAREDPEVVLSVTLPIPCIAPPFTYYSTLHDFPTSAYLSTPPRAVPQKHACQRIRN